MKKKLQKHFDTVLSLLFLIPLLFLGCAKNVEESSMTKKSPTRDINVVKEAHVEELMAIPGVVGVYVGALDDGTPCIGIMVVKITEETEKKIPRELEGHPVKIDVTGEIKPLN